MAGFGQPVTASFDWLVNPAVGYAAMRWLRDGDVDVAAALGTASWGTLDLELLDPDAHLSVGRKLVLDLEGDDVAHKGGHVISDDARHYNVTNRTVQAIAFEGEWFDKYATRFTAPIVGATAPLTVAPGEVLQFTANKAALTVVQRTTAVSWQQRLINRESGGTTPVTTHGAGVAAWGALPPAGAFVTETRTVADLTGSGRTGSGAAIWDGNSWQPLGGAVGVSLTTETFTATAGQSVFTLARAPSTPANTQLTLRGLSRDFGTDYTIAGAIVTLTMAGVTVSAGDTVIIQYD